ncbi:MAG: MFS transporter [Alicyclobacillus sp.]|nr:MFS transporter [Alicyclobacillus sp.]
MADRIGATRVVKFSTLLLGLGYTLTGLVHSEAAWFGTTAINGLGGALLGSTENIVVSQLAEGQNRARVMSRFFAMYTFVIGAGALAAGPMSLYLGYQDTLLTGAVFSLVAPVIRYFVRLEDVRAHRMFKWPSRRLVAMSLYNLLYGIGFGLFNPFATLLLKGQFHLSDSVVAALSAMSTFTAALGGLLPKAYLRALPWRMVVGLLLGGILMGYGARIAFGCNIGAYFSGIATFSLHGWEWFIGAMIGSVIGVAIRPVCRLANR